MYYRPSYQNNIHLMVVWLNKGHDHFVSRILLYQKIRYITIYIATWIIDNNVTTEALCLQKNMVALSRIQLPQLLQSTLRNDIFSQPPFCQGVVHSMLIVLQRHYFIKWKRKKDQRKVPGFKQSYSYWRVLSYFACGKTRLRCRRLALNNKCTKKDTFKCFQLLIYVYLCW